MEQKIIVIYGGRSSEREVSLRSGLNVYKALEKLGYKNLELLDFKAPPDYSWINILLELKNSNQIKLVIPMTHGEYGEDGKLQSFLELLDIPYLGSNPEASCIAMSKIRTKEILAKHGLPVLEFIKPDSISKESKFPLICKPSHGGSSLGLHKINSYEEFLKLQSEVHLEEYLIEEFIDGIELTTSIIESSFGLDLKDSIECQYPDRYRYSLPLLELRPKNELYDYEAKYTKGMTEFICPAEISSELTARIHNYALKTFEILGLRNMSRVDFIIDKSNMKPYILEANTLPGMTDTSDLPYQAQAAGLSYEELLGILINNTGIYASLEASISADNAF